MVEGHNQYAPMPGVPALRLAIAEVIKNSYQHQTDWESEITVTAGGTEAIFATIAALISQGDEVILFDPSYDSYDPAIRLNGGVPIHLNLTPPEFAIDWSAVEKKITARTKMIMVNTPHNPAGSVLSSDDVKALEALAVAHDLIVLSDEVYERIIFENKTHESVLKYPRLRERSIAVFSFGKNISRHRLESRLRRRSRKLNARNQESASVYYVQCEYPCAIGPGRIFNGSGKLSPPWEILPAKKGFLFA